jgi:hypothetical protein
MTFTPRIPPEILSQLLARVIASNEAGLTDVSEGGVLTTILGSVAQELSNLDLRIYALSQSFFMELEGADLDRRIAEFPSSFARRMGATSAYGGAFYMYRETTTDALAIPARTMVVSSSANPKVTYTNVSQIIFEAGSNIPSTPLNPSFIALTPGTQGNLASVSAIDTIVSGVADIVECSNTQPITGAQDREADDVLRRRAQRWLASLALCQNNAIETLALSFTSSTGASLTHARIWNDPDMRGYSELVVDNGGGMDGLQETVAAKSYLLPNLQGDGNRFTAYFQAPAVTSPVLYVSGIELPASDVHVLHEKGVAYIREDPSVAVEPGESITVSEYTRYTGIIEELQTLLNNSAIAAGTRVRVVPPTRQLISLSADMTVITGSNINAVRIAVRDAIISFVARLAPGEPLFMYKLIGELNQLPEVLNIVFDQTDMYPGSIRHKLVATAEGISLR